LDLSNPIHYPRFRPMSVRTVLASCLRYWCSSRYQRILLLHRPFRLPLPVSSLAVFPAVSRLSRKIWPKTHQTA